MNGLIKDELKFRALVLLLAFCPLLHGRALYGVVDPPSPPLYDCYDMPVEADAHAALMQLALWNQPIVNALFGIEPPCGGVFTLEYEPVLSDFVTPTGHTIALPILEDIPGNYVYGSVSLPFECELFGYWQSDLAQPPWSTRFTPEELAHLSAMNFVMGLVWAELSTDLGSVYVSWELLAFDTQVADPARAVILLADGSTETDPVDIFQCNSSAACNGGIG